jgi:hypothetical protein
VVQSDDVTEPCGDLERMPAQRQRRRAPEGSDLLGPIYFELNLKSFDIHIERVRL